MDTRQDVSKFLERKDILTELPKLTKQKIQWVLDELGIAFKLSSTKADILTVALGAVYANSVGVDMDKVVDETNVCEDVTGETDDSTRMKALV